MRVFLIYALAYFSVDTGLGQSQLICSLPQNPLSFSVTEGEPNGTIIKELEDQYDLTLTTVDDVRYTTAYFIDLINGTLILNATLQPDIDEALCQKISAGVEWRIRPECGNGWDYWNIAIVLTNDYPPEFNGNYESKEISELTAPGTLIVTLGDTQLKSQDCNVLPTITSTTVFEIESGNENDTFIVGNRTGIISLRRRLDYENGDIHFLLNISLSDQNSTQSKSFATWEVNVTNADDNSPVFNCHGYTVHVKEENSTLQGMWMPTKPLIAVHDPDGDMMESLQIMLFDPASAPFLELNEGTREVRFNRTFDREQVENLQVVLKVQQNISTWMSSTTTLTVIVDDINDNRPLFSPSDYNVQIAEHSAANTFVVLLTARDMDTGDNAKFNYTLRSAEDIFSLETKEMGQQLVGLVTVRNGSLLDREEQTHIDFMIGTEELTPSEGGDCSGGHCSATVIVTLLDINDNSPVFAKDSYVVPLNNFTVGDVIVTVTATDADEGTNAVLIYSLRSASITDCPVVIDSVSGEVRLDSSQTKSQECAVLVTACDQPVDTWQRRCTSVPLLIVSIASNNMVLLSAPVSDIVLQPDKIKLQHALSEVLDVLVTILYILPGPTADSADIYISAQNKTSNDPVPKERLERLIDMHKNEIEALFENYKQQLTTTVGDNDNDNEKEEKVKEEDFSAAVIALIVVASVLLIAFVIAVVHIYKGRRSNKRKQRLIQRLSVTNDLYSQADLLHKAENGTASIISMADDERTEGLGVINPIFEDDQNTSLETTPRSQSDEAFTAQQYEGHDYVNDPPSERNPDTDSGVLSDRENGAGDSDVEDGNEASPTMTRKVGQGYNAYLTAVLSSQALLSSSRNADDRKDGEHDVVDVTSVDHHPINEEVDSHNFTSADPIYASVNKGKSSHLPPPAGISAADQKVQENSVNYVDDTDQESSHLISIDSASSLLPTSGGVRDENHEEVEEAGGGSKLGLLVRPSTPPMHHRSTNKAEEEDEMPDEPEPDYAKKVRFNTQVLEQVITSHEKSEADDERVREKGPEFSPEISQETSEASRSGNQAEDTELTEQQNLESPSPFNLHEEVTAL